VSVDVCSCVCVCVCLCVCWASPGGPQGVEGHFPGGGHGVGHRGAPRPAEDPEDPEGPSGQDLCHALGHRVQVNTLTCISYVFTCSQDSRFKNFNGHIIHIQDMQ